MATPLKVGSVQIPYFYGDPDHDVMPISAWIVQVTNCKGISGWTDPNTALSAQLTLRGKASTWLQNELVFGNTAGCLNWEEHEPNNLPTLLKKRFHSLPTLAQKSQLLAALKQKADEKIMDFFDRVYAAILILFEDFPPPTAAAPGPPTNAEIATNKEQKKVALQQQVKLIFASGVVESIREELVSSDADTLPELTAIAVRLEAAQLDKKKAIIQRPPEFLAHAISTDDAASTSATTCAQQMLPPQHADATDPFCTLSQLKDEIQRAAVDAVWAKPQFRGRGGARNFRARGGAWAPHKGRPGQRGPAPQAGRGRFDPKSVTCHYCKKPGHMIRECRLRQRNNSNRGGNRVNALNAWDMQARYLDPPGIQPDLDHLNPYAA